MRLALLTLFLLSTAVLADGSRTIACENIAGESERWYRLNNSSWFTEERVEVKINGEWVNVCDESYMPLNKPITTKTGITYQLTSLSSKTGDMANQCLGNMKFEEPNGSTNELSVMWIIDLEKATYEELRSKTGSFNGSDVYKREQTTCRVVE